MKINFSGKEGGWNIIKQRRKFILAFIYISLFVVFASFSFWTIFLWRVNKCCFFFLVIKKKFLVFSLWHQKFKRKFLFFSPFFCYPALSIYFLVQLKTHLFITEIYYYSFLIVILLVFPVSFNISLITININIYCHYTL